MEREAKDQAWMSRGDIQVWSKESIFASNLFFMVLSRDVEVESSLGAIRNSAAMNIPKQLPSCIHANIFLGLFIGGLVDALSSMGQPIQRSSKNCFNPPHQMSSGRCKSKQWDATTALLKRAKSRTLMAPVLARIQSNRHSHTLLWGTQNGRATLEDTLVLSYKTKALLLSFIHSFR